MPSYTSVTQNGRVLTQPGVFSTVDTAGFTTSGLPNSTNIAIIAQSLGGPPAGATKPDGSPEDQMVFISATDAAAQLKGGDALWMLQRAMTNGAGAVFVVRPNQGTSASATLYDVNSAPSLTLRSKDYSAATNSIYAFIEAGTISGKRVTISDGTAANTIRQDNLYKQAFTIYYNSAHVSLASASTLTINSTGITTSLTGYKTFTIHYNNPPGTGASCTVAVGGGNLTLTSATAGESVTLSLGTYPTMISLLSAINSFVPLSGASLGVTGIYTATMIYGGIGGNNATSTLATQTAIDCKTATPTLLATGTDLNLPYTSYPNLASLQTALSSSGAYILASYNADLSMFTSNLDYLTAANIKDASNITSVTATLQEIVNFLNGPGSLLVYATRTGGLTPALGTTYLLGGSDNSSPSNQNWQTAFDQAKSLNVGLVVCGSSSPTIQQYAVTHANTMSDGTQGRSERVAILGCGNAETKTTALANAATYNSGNACYVWPSIKDYDPTGTLKDQFGQALVTVQPGYYAAADIAGKLSSLPTRNSISGQPIAIRGLQNTLVDQDLIDCANGGVLCLTKSTPQANGTGIGFSVYWAVTTYIGATNYALHEISVSRVLQVVARSIREDLLNWKLANMPVADGVTKGIILSRVTGVLNDLASGNQPLLVGDNNSPPFQILGVEFKGGSTALISLQVQPAIPINFISVYITARPYQSIVTFTTNIPFGG